MDVQENDYEELAGDPDHLQKMAQHYLGIADKIRKSVPFLHTLSEGDDQKSKATDALKDSAKTVADDIDKAEARYRVTAQALLEYVPFQRQAKDDAHTAVLKIKEAQGDVTSTGKTLDAANDTADKADDTQKDTAKTAQDKAKTASDAAKKDLQHWQQKWREARDFRNTHAHSARNKINDLLENHNQGLKNPEHHWYDGITHFVSSAWHATWNAIKKGATWLRDALIVIGKWAGVLSLFLGWVPILGDVLIGLAVLGAVMQLVKDWQSGAGWKTLLSDGIGIALTAFGSGAGKYFGKLAKLSREARYGKLESEVMNGSKTGDEFSKAFGFRKATFMKARQSGDYSKLNGSKFLQAGDKEYANMSGMKSFMKDVRNPFKFETGHGGVMANVRANVAKGPEEFQKFIHNPLGLNIKDMGTDAFKGLPNHLKIPVIAADSRKVLSSTEKIVNFTSNDAHGNWGQEAHGRNNQVYLSPEKVPFHITPGT